MSNQVLIQNLQDQLVRLVEQLRDLDEEKPNLEEGEFEEMRKDTMDQLQELSASLEKMEGGDISVIDSLTATKIAVRSAISEAFRTPEVIALFARKQPAVLRQKLYQIDMDRKLNKLDPALFVGKKVEILTALLALKDELSVEETEFLSQHSAASFDLKSVSGNTTCKDSFLI